MPRDPVHRPVSPNAREVTEKGTHTTQTIHVDISHSHYRGARTRAVLVQAKFHQGGGSGGYQSR